MSANLLLLLLFWSPGLSECISACLASSVFVLKSKEIYLPLKIKEWIIQGGRKGWPCKGLRSFHIIEPNYQFHRKNAYAAAVAVTQRYQKERTVYSLERKTMEFSSYSSVK